MIEYLLGMHETLGLKPSTEKKVFWKKHINMYSMQLPIYPEMSFLKASKLQESH